MGLNKAIEILKDKVNNNDRIIEYPPQNDFDKFVIEENKAIETVLKYLNIYMAKVLMTEVEI